MFGSTGGLLVDHDQNAVLDLALTGLDLDIALCVNGKGNGLSLLISCRRFALNQEVGNAGLQTLDDGITICAGSPACNGISLAFLDPQFSAGDRVVILSGR